MEEKEQRKKERKESLKKFVAKHGVDDSIKYLSSDSIPPELKADLAEIHAFNGNNLCLSVIYALA